MKLPTGARLAARALPCALAVTVLLPSAATVASARPPVEPQPGAGPVLLWNATAGTVAVGACLAPLDNPLHEVRAYAMMHLAVHDALNTIDPRFGTFTGPVPVTTHAASPEAAVATAARDVLAATIGSLPAACAEPGSGDVVRQTYDDALAAVPDGPAQDAGVAVGAAAAARVLAARASDGSDTPLVVADLPQGTDPGDWRFTPGFPFAFAPGWGDVDLFVPARHAHARRTAPLPVDSRRYAADLAEIAALGGDGVTTPTRRTADQSEVALFWWESSPLAWNRIARSVADAKGLDLWTAARMFALLDMALSDGYVTSWAAKYAEPTWRPVTAIREAATDGNPRTVADPTWTPLRPTPPIPEHYSAHAVEGSAAAQVLRRVLRTDRIAFTTCSTTLPVGGRCQDPEPVLRSFARLSDAAHENGQSRILIGYHFRHAVEDGIDVGRALGTHVVDTALRPLHAGHDRLG
jgi:hypothetical protein